MKWTKKKDKKRQRKIKAAKHTDRIKDTRKKNMHKMVSVNSGATIFNQSNLKCFGTWQIKKCTLNFGATSPFVWKLEFSRTPKASNMLQKTCCYLNCCTITWKFNECMLSNVNSMANNMNRIWQRFLWAAMDAIDIQSIPNHLSVFLLRFA